MAKVNIEWAEETSNVFPLPVPERGVSAQRKKAKSQRMLVYSSLLEFLPQLN
jgi:hypothetical protein